MTNDDGSGDADELKTVWASRLEQLGGAADLRDQLDEFPELREAIVPSGFESSFPDDGEVSYLALRDGAIEGQIEVWLRPPGLGAEAEPPEAGVVTLMLDTAEDKLLLENLYMPLRARRQGLGPLTVAAIAKMADCLSMASIELEAGQTGRYAWARCGFRFLDETEREKVLHCASLFAERLGVDVDLDVITEPWQLAELPGEVMRSQVAGAGGPAAPDGGGDQTWNLGRALLLGPPQEANPWFGALNPQEGNPERVRLDNYARRV